MHPGGGGGGGVLGIYTGGVCPGTPKPGDFRCGYSPPPPKKRGRGGLRCGCNQKGGVLGVGTTRKIGVVCVATTQKDII